MSAELLTSDVLVDAVGVGHEIAVHCETSLHGAVLNEVVHDGCLPLLGLEDGSDAVVLAGVELVVLEIAAVDALIGALGRIAVLGGVGEALLADDAVLLEIVPSDGQNAAVAAQVQLIAADHVLRGENDVDGSVAGDAEAVLEHFSGAECPACIIN